MITTGRWFDGKTAAPHQVDLELGGDALILRRAGEADIRWPLATIVRVASLPGGGATIMPVIENPERLVIEAPGSDAALKARCPKYTSLSKLGSGDRIKLARGMAVTAVVLAALILGIPLLAPVLARALPASADAWIGRQIAPQVERSVVGGASIETCDRPDARAALDRLNQRLATAAGFDQPVAIRVIRTDKVNALALPGQQVLVFGGLLTTLQHGDELAGVLAHEYAHLARRDPLTRFFATVLWSSLIDSVLGLGASHFAIPFLDAAHTREVEAATDRAGVDILRRAGIASEGFARSMEHFAARERPSSVSFGLLDSHPPSAERAAAIRVAGHAGGPAVTVEEWSALRSICR